MAPQPTEILYSDSLWPLILVSSIITTGLVLNIISLVQDIFCQGVLVWHRDNLGSMLSQLFFHSCILSTLFKLKKYVKSKEDREWARDFPEDEHIDFFDAFMPIFYFVSFYILKLTCLRTKYCVIKVIASVSVISLTILGETLFDKSDRNDAPIWLLAIPISILLVCQALLDYFHLQDVRAFKDRMFFCLDNPLKKIWVYGNLAATVVYCVCLVDWLWIIETNETNAQGKKEDAKVLHLALGSVIFYVIFLIERVGTYILDLFQEQFLFEFMG